MRTKFLLFVLSVIMGISALFAYDMTYVYTQYFGMSDGKVSNILMDRLDPLRSQSGKSVFVHTNFQEDKYHRGLAIIMRANDDWKICGYETHQFSETAWRDSTIQTLLANELAYLQESGWKIKKKIKNDYDTFDYILKKGKKDKITITFFNSWNFKVEQNIKSAFDELFE